MLSDKDFNKIISWVSDLEIQNFPRSKEELENIQELDLYDLPCNLFLDEISKLKSLKRIWFMYNDFDEIPNFIYSLENLEEINLSGNNISFIDDIISNLKNLKIFNIYENKISSISREITAASSASC